MKIQKYFTIIKTKKNNVYNYIILNITLCVSCILFEKESMNWTE